MVNGKQNRIMGWNYGYARYVTRQTINTAARNRKSRNLCAREKLAHLEGKGNVILSKNQMMMSYKWNMNTVG